MRALVTDLGCPREAGRPDFVGARAHGRADRRSAARGSDRGGAGRVRLGAGGCARRRRSSPPPTAEEVGALRKWDPRGWFPARPLSARRRSGRRWRGGYRGSEAMYDGIRDRSGAEPSCVIGDRATSCIGTSCRPTPGAREILVRLRSGPPVRTFADPSVMGSRSTIVARELLGGRAPRLAASSRREMVEAARATIGLELVGIGPRVRPPEYDDAAVVHRVVERRRRANTSFRRAG